jgi:hypothetical protein
MALDELPDAAILPHLFPNSLNATVAVFFESKWPPGSMSRLDGEVALQPAA